VELELQWEEEKSNRLQEEKLDDVSAEDSKSCNSSGGG